MEGWSQLPLTSGAGESTGVALAPKKRENNAGGKIFSSKYVCLTILNKCIIKQPAPAANRRIYNSTVCKIS